MRGLVWLLMFPLLAACSSDGSAPARSVGSANLALRYLRAQDEPGFARAVEARPLVFPTDHGSHPEFRTEWWYFTGNLESDKGVAYGFELTFFRVALRPQGAPGAGASQWRSDQVWLAHLAVTDTARHAFEVRERSAREALGLAGASRLPVTVWVKGWKAERTSADEGEQWRLTADDADLGLALDLVADRAPVLNGAAGLDRKGPEPGNASYYYSMPRLRATGFLRVGGGRQIAVHGNAWMDREWSTSALSDETVGWDWFGLRLSDGGSLMFYRLRRADGAAGEFSGGTLVDGRGQPTHLGPRDVELEARDFWRSPVSGVDSPIAWRLRVPARRLAIDVVPYLPDQEVNVSVRYWEGAVRGSGEGEAGPLTVDGYLELAGY